MYLIVIKTSNNRMSTLTKFGFSDSTKLVTLNWIRNNYKGKQCYPIALSYLSAKYIKIICEEWKAPASAYNPVVTYNTDIFKPLPNEYGSIVIHGSMSVSTKISQTHIWTLSVLNISEQMSIGLDEISGTPAYRMLMYHDENVNPSYDLSGFNLIENNRVICDLAHVNNGDNVVVRLRGTSLKVSIFNVRGHPKIIKQTITPGVYQLAVRLFNDGDSIKRTWMVSDELDLYKEDACTECGYLIEDGWFYCANCSNQLY